MQSFNFNLLKSEWSENSKIKNYKMFLNFDLFIPKVFRDDQPPAETFDFYDK